MIAMLLLALLALAGTPLFAVIAASAMLGFSGQEVDLQVMGIEIYRLAETPVLLAIPLYVLMASILQRSGIIEALYKAMELWFRRLPGGLAVGTIAICTVMAAMTGIVGAAVAAMGILALPSMLRRGYDEKLALGTICLLYTSPSPRDRG